MEFLLQIRVFLRHLFVFRLPLIPGSLKCLDFTLVVAGFDVGLTEPVGP